jgi:hypothetical protein
MGTRYKSTTARHVPSSTVYVWSMHNCWCSYSARIANICRVTRACWQRHAIVTSRRERVVPRRVVRRSKPATPKAPVSWHCHSFLDPHAVADAGPREVSRRVVVETHVVAAQIVDVVETHLNVVEAPRSLVKPHFKYKVWGGGRCGVPRLTWQRLPSPPQDFPFALSQPVNHTSTTTTIFSIYMRRSIPQYHHRI